MLQEPSQTHSTGCAMLSSVRKLPTSAAVFSHAIIQVADIVSQLRGEEVIESLPASQPGVLQCRHACLQVRNATPEDVNRSGLGRMAGGIALLWLASYAIGIPFKYGLAGALLAISAVLFAEWDQGNRARRARVHGGPMHSGTMVSPSYFGNLHQAAKEQCHTLPSHLCLRSACHVCGTLSACATQQNANTVCT